MILKYKEIILDRQRAVGKLTVDLCKFFKADHSIVPQYFLGTAILYDGAEYDGAKDIMDGQQR